MADVSARAVFRILTTILADKRFQFVCINVAVNLLMLGRSYLAMRELSELGLGYITLAQTLILLLTALQFGFLQGGFRLLCNKDGENLDLINSHYYTFQTALTIASIIGVSFYFIFNKHDENIFTIVILTGIISGIATLNKTWLGNQLVAKGFLDSINVLTLLTAILSLIPLLAVSKYPLEAVLASMLAQPLLFVVIGLLRNADLRPRGLALERLLLKRIMAAGFLVFVSGMLLQLATLVERWFVGSTLGIETLGKIYLVILFITLFQIVPTALDNVMLPRAIALSRAGDAPALKRAMRLFLAAMAAYCLCVALALAAFAEPLLNWLLPQRVGDLRFVFTILPGLIAFTMAGPIAMTFNILIDYRGYILAYGLGALLTCAVLGVAALRSTAFSLEGVIVLRSASYATMAVIIIGVFLQICRSRPEFRFWRR